MHPNIPFHLSSVFLCMWIFSFFLPLIYLYFLFIFAFIFPSLSLLCILPIMLLFRFVYISPFPFCVHLSFSFSLFLFFYFIFLFSIISFRYAFLLSPLFHFIWNSLCSRAIYFHLFISHITYIIYHTLLTLSSFLFWSYFPSTVNFHVCCYLFIFSLFFSTMFPFRVAARARENDVQTVETHIDNCLDLNCTYPTDTSS